MYTVSILITSTLIINICHYVGLLKYLSSVCRDDSVFWRFAAALSPDAVVFNLLTENITFCITADFINCTKLQYGHWRRQLWGTQARAPLLPTIGSRALSFSGPLLSVDVNVWLFVCGGVCLSATLRSNISKTKGARRKVTMGSL